MSRARTIDSRFLPPVKGVDLAQSLNYLALPDVGVDFIYDRYTGARLPYRAGSRPALEQLAARVTHGLAAPRDAVLALATYVAKQMPWAGYFHQREGHPLPPDRALDEEALLVSGYGWCNEQARVLCALTQVRGIPSRLVFGANLERRYGHVVVEALLPEGWLLIDQSFGYGFLREGRPVRAVDVYGDPACRAYFSPLYKRLCRDLERELGTDILKTAFAMSLAEDPLDGFKDLGFHNHFIV